MKLCTRCGRREELECWRSWEEKRVNVLHTRGAGAWAVSGGTHLQREREPWSMRQQKSSEGNEGKPALERIPRRGCSPRAVTPKHQSTYFANWSVAFWSCAQLLPGANLTSYRNGFAAGHLAAVRARSSSPSDAPRLPLSFLFLYQARREHLLVYWKGSSCPTRHPLIYTRTTATPPAVALLAPLRLHRLVHEIGSTLTLPTKQVYHCIKHVHPTTQINLCKWWTALPRAGEGEVPSSTRSLSLPALPRTNKESNNADEQSWKRMVVVKGRRAVGLLLVSGWSNNSTRRSSRVGSVNSML